MVMRWYHWLLLVGLGLLLNWFEYGVGLLLYWFQ
jgi:hypothetical protein